MQPRSTRRALLPLAAAAVTLAALPAAHAEFAITGLGSARAGEVTLSGMNPAAAKDNSLAGGNFVLFLSGSKNAGGGYSGGFSCSTVATTADGAMAGWSANTVPVTHTWSNAFTGQENFAGNNTGGGFGSYGNTVGDSNGPFCNDEARVYLATPFGTFAAGNMINPLRNLYDNATVDPYYGNEYVYYQTSDYRANGLRYGNSWGDFAIDVQLNLYSGNAPAHSPRKGEVLTALATYDFGPVQVGYGFGGGNSAAPGSKYTDVGAGLTYKGTQGVYVRTSLGPVGIGATVFNGKVGANTFTGAPTSIARNMTDYRLKLTYASGKWSYVGIAGVMTEKGDFTGDAAFGNPMYTFVNSGISAPRIKITRDDLDLFAMYDLGSGLKPYLRYNILSKKYSTPDNAAASAKGTAQTIEGGVQVSF